MTYIPKHHVENVVGYRSYMQPTRTNDFDLHIPPLVNDLIPYGQVTHREVSPAEIDRLLLSQLIFLREYTRVIYHDGDAENCPGWAIDFMQQTDNALRAAIADRAKGRALFSSLEKAMRYTPGSAKPSMEILTVLKTAYNPEVKVNVVGTTAFYIMNNCLRDPAFKASAEAVHHKTVWATWGPFWAELFVQEHPADEELSPGIYDEAGRQVRDAYVFLARVLVYLAGMKKAAVSRVLGVSRRSVIDWTSGTQEEGSASA